MSQRSDDSNKTVVININIYLPNRKTYIYDLTEVMTTPIIPVQSQDQIKFQYEDGQGWHPVNP